MKDRMIITSIALLTTLTASILGVLVANQVKGQNYSDVGIPMYRESGSALAAGSAAYIACWVALVFVARKFVSKPRSPMIPMVVIPLCALPLEFILLQVITNS